MFKMAAIVIFVLSLIWCRISILPDVSKIENPAMFFAGDLLLTLIIGLAIFSLLVAAVVFKRN